MPGWHDAVQDLYQSGEIQIVGVIQEQHPDRCRLFMQWKRMDWPILVDSLNLLEVEAVPITVAIDEHGIVRHKGLRLDKADEFRSGFLETAFDPPASEPEPAAPAAWPEPEPPAADDDQEAWSRFAHQLLLAGDPARLDDAIEAYRRALELAPSDGWTRFRLGVALRRRYDSPHRRDGDFQAAVDAWKQALDIDPNQYIWRRRIQQYGPRLDKPYPFYDWVAEAREDIRARGEEPVPLIVEPGGAELAAPRTELSDATPEETVEPDPDDRIYRDEGELIAVETVAAPSSIRPGEALRAHIVFRPRAETKAHWNNEVEGLETWAEAPTGCRLDRPARELSPPPEAVSLEERKVEYEVRCDEDAAAGPRRLAGYALYYVCEDVNGTCLYRRQDFEVPFEVD